MSCPSKSEELSWIGMNLCYNQDWEEVSETTFCAVVAKSFKTLISTRTASVSVDVHYAAILFVNICAPAESFWKCLPKGCKAKLAVVLSCPVDRRENPDHVTSRWQIAMASWSHCLLAPAVHTSLPASQHAAQHFLPISPNQLTCNCFCSSRITHMVLQLFCNSQRVPGVFFSLFDGFVRACLWRDPSARWPRDLSILREAWALHTEHHSPHWQMRPTLCTHSRWHLWQHNNNKI